MGFCRAAHNIAAGFLMGRVVRLLVKNRNPVLVFACFFRLPVFLPLLFGLVCPVV